MHAWQEIVQLVFSMGRSRNFTGNKYFSIGVDSAACRIEGCDHKYKAENGSEVHATPLIGHLKTFKLLNYTFKLTFLTFRIFSNLLIGFCRNPNFWNNNVGASRLSSSNNILFCKAFDLKVNEKSNRH